MTLLNLIYKPALRFSIKVPGLTLGSDLTGTIVAGIPSDSLTPGIRITPTCASDKTFEVNQ